MATKTKLIKKGVKKLKEVQEDLFPDTLPKSPEAIKKATKEQQDKLKRDQMDMFPEDLAKRQKDAQMKKDMLGKKSKKKKAVKKAEGGPVEKFGAGGEILKTLWKNRPRLKTVKETESLKKKKLREKKKKEKTETKSGPVTKSSDFDPGTSKHMSLNKKQKEIQKRMDAGEFDRPVKKAGGGRIKTERERAQEIVDKGYAKVKARREKAKRIAKGDMNPKKYASGGRVKKSKSIDGIAQRGFTRAKHR